MGIRIAASLCAVAMGWTLLFPAPASAAPYPYCAPRGPCPREFRDDVVRVARYREDGVTIEQIAADFGIHPMTLSKWMRVADADEGAPCQDCAD